jgi:tRNA G18 (ribose-2'-O)-methylase SpoU|tara:strand:- start:480 stop:593 length:114 start_codon:yes stop_codon:yes gene_type:complete
VQKPAKQQQLPMTGRVDSLNISAASAMALYELARKQA